MYIFSKLKLTLNSDYCVVNGGLLEEDVKKMWSSSWVFLDCLGVDDYVTIVFLVHKREI